MEEDVLDRFEVRDLPAGARRSLFRAAAHDGVSGGDAHIAEIARASGAGRVVSENRRHFDALLRHGIEVLTTA